MSLPALSAILVTRDSWTTLRRALHYLQQQTVAAQLEVVIVAPPAAPVALPPEIIARFQSVLVVRVEVIRTREQAGAAGVRAARAPAIVFVEDHVFAAPDWAAVLIAAHAGDWAAVGPLVSNTCPGLLAYTCHLADYGHWYDPALAGAVPLLSNSNTSYKRAALLALPGRLEDWLDHQTPLQRHLLAQGQRLLFEPRARLWHLNFSQPLGWAFQRLDDGWVFGFDRSRPWSLARRLLYVLAAPLIPLANLPRLLGVARRTGTRGGALLRLLPALLVLVGLAALGEVLGYLFSGAAAQARLHDREFDRLRFITARDRQTLDQTLAQLIPPAPPSPVAARPAPASVPA